MNTEQSLALAISIVLCICLTINSVILAKDLSIPTTKDEPWQSGLGTRLITMLVMWAIWLLITFEFIPWSNSTQTQAQMVTDSPNITKNWNESGEALVQKN